MGLTTYAWLSSGEIETLINPVLSLRGMAQLNINEDRPTCRVLGAWKDDSLIEFLVLQLFPVLGPIVRCDSDYRDNGETTRELVNRMGEYLKESNARGFLVVADSPVTGRLCERNGLVKMTSPVYTEQGKGLERNDYTPGAVQ